MKMLMNALVAHVKTQGDSFFCLLGLVCGGGFSIWQCLYVASSMQSLDNHSAPLAELIW